MPIDLSIFDTGSPAVSGQRKGWKQKIYDFLNDGKAHNRREIKEALGIRVQMVRQYLEDMKKNGTVVERELTVVGDPAHLWYMTQESIDKAEAAAAAEAEKEAKKTGKKQ